MLYIYFLIRKLFFSVTIFLIFTDLHLYSFTAADGHSSYAWRNMLFIMDISTMSSIQCCNADFCCEKLHERS
jgi:hypothetical protein